MLQDKVLKVLRFTIDKAKVSPVRCSYRHTCLKPTTSQTKRVLKTRCLRKDFFPFLNKVQPRAFIAAVSLLISALQVTSSGNSSKPKLHPAFSPSPSEMHLVKCQNQFLLRYRSFFYFLKVVRNFYKRHLLLLVLVGAEVVERTVAAGGAAGMAGVATVGDEQVMGVG